MGSKRVNVSVPAELFDRMELARGDVSRSRFVQRALESALSSGSGVRAEVSSVSVPPPSGSAPSRVSAKKVEVALEVRDAVQKRNAEQVFSCPRSGCMFVSGSPGVCVHHRTEKLR